MGGEEAFANKLDAVFTSPNSFKPGTYGRPIHEMTEMAALDMGQYAHGNEPIHHMIYLYNYVGNPGKPRPASGGHDKALSAHSRRPVRRRRHRPDLGLVCVQRARFLPGLPRRHVLRHRQPGFRQSHTQALQREDLYRDDQEQRAAARLHSWATLNSEVFDRTYLTHEQLVGGGEIVFDMSSEQNHKWGDKPGEPAARAIEVATGRAVDGCSPPLFQSSIRRRPEAGYANAHFSARKQRPGRLDSRPPPLGARALRADLVDTIGFS